MHIHLMTNWEGDVITAVASSIAVSTGVSLRGAGYFVTATGPHEIAVSETA